jgi:hypothetical protein
MLQLSIAFALAISLLPAQQGGRGGAGGSAPARIAPIEERTAGMQRIDGYFPLYWDERTGSLFLEIPRFDTDFLYTTGLAAGLGSNDIGLDRGQERRQACLLPARRAEGADGAAERVVPQLQRQSRGAAVGGGFIR